MAFRDLEKRKHKSFLEKQYADARVNTEQKLYGASFNGRKVAIPNYLDNSTKINKANYLKSFYRKKNRETF